MFIQQEEFELTETEVPTFFTSACTGKTRLQQSQVPETSGISHGKVGIPSVEGDQVREHSSKLDIGESMGLMRCTGEC